MCHRSGQPHRHSDGLSSRLAASDFDAMVKQYLAGETAVAPAKRYGISLKSVRRTLQERGVRKQG